MRNLWWCVWLAGCSAEAGAPEVRPPNVVVITLDTTRADALSCYGRLPGLPYQGPTTPNLDAFAASGVQFNSAWAHTPTTLSSHTSMFSGLDPHGHAVPRNGFPLAASVPTLATRLSDAGYDTIAVVGAKALERGMGLDRGFRVYDDATPERRALMFQDTADSVRARAEAAVSSRHRDQPLFLWVHFYDAHAPYEPPPPWNTRFDDPVAPLPFKVAGRRLGRIQENLAAGIPRPAEVAHVAAQYQGEVAFVDAQVGGLLDALGQAGILDRAIIAITADHGEGLSDTPQFAYSHGSDVSASAAQVPLLVRGYGDVKVASRSVVNRQVPLAGLAPTLLEAARVGPSLGDYPSFYHMLRPGPTWDAEGWPDRPVQPVRVEASRPREIESDKYWNNLPMRRSMQVGEHGVYRFPYRGDEQASDPRIAELVGGLLSDWDGRAPPHRAEAMSDATSDALRALGYVDGPPGAAPGASAAPDEP
jgi:arylsulfatase A-like enzyme